MIGIKRIYDPAEEADGRRILVDRLWPRGLSKDKAHIDDWLKEIAPSDELRHFFGHDPQRWPEFRERYRQELTAHREELDRLRELAAGGRVTLVYAARDIEHNNAVVLKELLLE
ncbi:hypothetical protein GMST_37790 [Geomonas silvestris]|uniref:DUF488 domain-containing protein n=1 Tax=Geomonas silvestris TaxID=2740184 RepID=A0A6V8MNE1_9BACT|nr:DUF488 domain-containing protein [Geomonas silvestris]GFO61454.1 hypothetical protein GMST_37790 [Geomonas silvestris]